MKYYRGRFVPHNPSKYNGNPTNIIYRSSWEFRVMRYLDENSSIVQWSSEELAIPYVSPLDGRVHRYFPDFIVKIKREVLMVDEDLGVEGEENAPVRLVPETVLKAVLIAVGQESCHVGFLPRHIALRPMEVERLSGKFAQVLELYDDLDDSKHKRTKSARNQGMASFILMENIQELE
jgi:hypothetical protein